MVEGYVFVLSEEKYSYSMIKKYCDMHGIKIYFSFIMSQINKLWVEGYVFVFSVEKYSYSVIQKHCDMHGIKIYSSFKMSQIKKLWVEGYDLFFFKRNILIP